MKRIQDSALHRIRSVTDQQKKTIASVRSGRPFEAEYEAERFVARMKAETFIATQAMVLPPEAAPRPPRAAPPGAERIWGNTTDFVGVAFLQSGVHAARPVGRVAWRDGRPQGTGFLVAPGLFLTNNHVIGSPEEAALFAIEFDYEVDTHGRRRDMTRFALAPSEFFITDDTNDLDYTLIAIGDRLDGAQEISEYGFNALSAAGNKHMLGEVANIIQHPDGRMKEVVLRENRLVSRLEHVLHYVADTEPGSSGSPVFNNEWQVIALHHWGGPWRQTLDAQGSPVPRFVNEGIRISAIVDELEARRGELSVAERERLDGALALGESTAGTPQPGRAPGDGEGRVRLRRDGTAVWRVPIEITVGVPGVGSTVANAIAATSPPLPPSRGNEAFRRTVDKDYDTRKGYRDRFLPGHVVPVPVATAAVAGRLARNLHAEAGEDPHEFPYHHFSVYVDGQRGLPLITACNIDGKNLKSINRTTGAVTDAERLARDGGSEAREKWYEDPRIAEGACGSDALYTNQVVSAGPNRLGRIFHRGHMVRRLDPCWGSKTRALRAEADTFHFTNCTPQVGKFNSGKTLWQGIENHVLDNARAEDQRVTVFTGPVLDDAGDPEYRTQVFPGFRVPLQFWKVAIWDDRGELSALAMIADQSEALVQLPEAAEALDDDEGVRDFITTIPDIEELTGLDFGDTVRNADLYERAEAAGRLRREVGRYAEIRLERAARRKGNRKGKKGHQAGGM